MPTFKFGRSTTALMRQSHMALGNVRPRFNSDRQNLVKADTNSGESFYQNNRFNPVFDKLEQGSVLEDWVPRDAPGINMMFRRMHVRDVVAGPAIDIYASMPWSEFDIGGIKDPALRRFYEEALAMFTPEVLTTIAKEFLVIGRFCASLVFNSSKGYFDQFEPHDPDFLEIMPVPYRGFNPLIDLRISPAMRMFMQSQDERVKRIRGLMPAQFLEKFNQNTGKVPLDQFSTLFMARKISPYDSVGTSMLTRIVGLWALEKALMDATVTAARRRAGTILHVTAGIDEVWEPADGELDNIANLFTQADEDPVGAVVTTRTGVQAQELRQGGQIWKISDEWAFLSEAKMRALGISDAILDGSATYSNMETARSLMVEQILVFRQQFTQALFGWISEQLARAHGFVNDPKRAANNGQIRMAPSAPIPGLRKDMETQSAIAMSAQRRALYNAYGKEGEQYIEAAEEQLQNRIRKTQISMEKALKLPRDHLIVPTIQWRKEMKPTQDAAYIELLEKMEEKGLPVPKRIWAAAGGYDLDAAIEMMEEDKKLTAKIDQIMQDAGQGGGAPGEETAPTGEPKAPAGEGLKKLDTLLGPGGGEGGEGGGGGEVAPEKPGGGGGGSPNPAENPAPPSEVKPKKNPMASFIGKLPFFSNEKFAGLRRHQAMMVAQQVDTHIQDVLANPKAIHQIVRANVQKEEHRPIALYLCARGGLNVGPIPDKYVEVISKSLCAAGMPAKRLLQELHNLALLTRAITPDGDGGRANREATAKMQGTALGSMSADELANLPNNSKYLLGGKG